MPLEDSTVIDAILPPDANGKVCLVITDAGVTTDPAVRLQLLSDKIQTYAHEVWSGSFIHDHPDKQAGDFIIKVVCQQPPTDAMQGITSVGELGHQIPVVFEVLALETRVEAGPEPEYLWSDVLAQAFAEFNNDQKFFAMQAEMLTAALASAGTMNFVFGRAYRGDGTAREIVSVSQGQPADETAGLDVIAKARAMGQQSGLEFEYWFVIYTALREAEELEEPQLWVVAEGWKRGQNRGIAIGQIFQRDDSPHAVGEPRLIGIVPVDVFNAPPAPAPKPEVKPAPRPPRAPRPPFPWRMVAASLMIVAIAVAGYFTHQKYPDWWRMTKPAQPEAAATTPSAANDSTDTNPATSTVADDSTASLNIYSAEFVTGKHVDDVTARLRELLHDQPEGFKADAKTLLIDPPDGKRKHLTIRYSYQGTNYSFNFLVTRKLSLQSLIERTQSK
ncbi:MAG TPA: DUF6572 domain-containing protein [Verrucomicrobiae bacterium]|jgi:hypothetical protein